jgi:GNAT superfamily N-acetyltransferase
MTDNGAAVSIRRATTHDSLDHLSQAAFSRAQVARGGRALLEQLWGSDVDSDRVRNALAADVDAGLVWVAEDAGEIIAGVLVRDRCVRVIWVQAAHRRQRIATALLDALLKSDDPPHDAWALPGDRATKSLYESVGWKARLLTMRGE